MKLDFSKLKAAPVNTGPSVNATSLIEGLDADANLGGALRRFIGTFQQLAKTEMGSATFRAKVDALPGYFLTLASNLNSPTAVAEFLTTPGRWADMAVWLDRRNIDSARVEALLKRFVAEFNGPTDETDDLGRELIEEFLKPVLETMK